MKLTTKMIAQNAIVAALYLVLTVVSYPLSFGLIQFRIAEVLMLLCFMRKDFVIGVTVGCLLSNLMMSSSALGSTGWIDIFAGTAATLIAGLIMPYCKRLFIASLMPAIFNGIIIGLELTYVFAIEEMLWVSMGWVFLGEFVVCSIFGYILFMSMKKWYPSFFKMIDQNRNLEAKW